MKAASLAESFRVGTFSTGTMGSFQLELTLLEIYREYAVRSRRFIRATNPLNARDALRLSGPVARRLWPAADSVNPSGHVNVTNRTMPML
jgi:hypothetical protein